MRVQISPSNFVANESVGSSAGLKVLAEAIHNIVTGNFSDFREEELSKALGSWTNPFPKPILREHQASLGWLGGDPEEVVPIGRVIDAKMTSSVLNPGHVTHLLTLDITDEKAKERVQDNRYLTLSIGATIGNVECSICGHNFIKAKEFCEHKKGQEYKGKTCTWVLKDIQFYEVSFVNDPADKYAQVLSVEMGGNKMNQTSVIDSPVKVNHDGGSNDSSTSNLNSSPNILDNIDRLVHESQKQEPMDIQESIKALFTKQEDSEGRLQSIDESIQKIEETIAQVKESIVSESNGEERVFKQNIELAKMIKEQMAERLSDLSYLSNEFGPEEYSFKYQEYLNLSSKELTSAIKEKLDNLFKKAPRQIPRVISQNLATKSKQDTDDSLAVQEDIPVKSSSNEPASLEDFLKTITEGFLKR